MTAEQTFNAWLLLAPLTVVFIGELALLFARPGWLARLAYLPLGRPRRAMLSPATRAALSILALGHGWSSKQPPDLRERSKARPACGTREHHIASRAEGGHATPPR